MTPCRRASPTRRSAPSRPGMRSPAMPPAPARGRWTGSCRASGSNSSRTPPTGMRSACRRSTGWCCCRCRKRTRAPRRCCPARSTGSRIRRPTRCRRSSSAASSIYQNEQPHVWPWQFSRIEGSPWNDLRVRKAANLCVDRNAMKDGLLGGLMVSATGTFEPGHPWRGNPKFQIKYDPNEARKLMTEAGFSADQEAEGEDADLGVGLRPDAAAADERVRAAEPRGVLLRGRARRDRVEHAVHQLAQGREGRSPRAARTPPT